MKRRERGQSIIEFSLMAPWLLFMFIGAMDWGFYAYALIASEAAARVACLYTSTSSSTATDSTTACTYALEQLRKMPNVGTSVTTCAASPVTVSATLLTGSSSPDGNNAAQVQVTYTTPVYMPMMGYLPKQLTITRSVTMRLRG